MAWSTLTARSAGDAILASDQQAWVNNLNALRGDYGIFRRTAGNLTLNSTNWSDLPTIGTTFDITLAASAGDLIEAGFHMLMGNQAVAAGMDVITVVGSTKTNSLASAGSVPANYAAFNGSGFYCSASTEVNITGSIVYTAQAGDISSSTVKLRPQYVTATATNRTLFANSQNPFVFWARNHGPVEI